MRGRAAMNEDEQARQAWRDVSRRLEALGARLYDEP